MPCQRGGKAWLERTKQTTTGISTKAHSTWEGDLKFIGVAFEGIGQHSLHVLIFVYAHIVGNKEFFCWFLLGPKDQLNLVNTSIDMM